MLCVLSWRGDGRQFGDSGHGTSGKDQRWYGDQFDSNLPVVRDSDGHRNQRNYNFDRSNSDCRNMPDSQHYGSDWNNNDGWDYLGLRYGPQRDYRRSTARIAIRDIRERELCALQSYCCIYRGDSHRHQLESC